jgi:hypothetical protein
MKNQRKFPGGSLVTAVRTIVLCLCLLFAVRTFAQQGAAGVGHGGKSTFTTFEAPGAGKGNSQGTIAFNINTTGDITGTYIDASDVYHGFVRAANGKITTFEVRGAGTGVHQGNHRHQHQRGGGHHGNLH